MALCSVVWKLNLQGQHWSQRPPAMQTRNWRSEELARAQTRVFRSELRRRCLVQLSTAPTKSQVSAALDGHPLPSLLSVPCWLCAGSSFPCGTKPVQRWCGSQHPQQPNNNSVYRCSAPAARGGSAGLRRKSCVLGWWQSLPPTVTPLKTDIYI